LLFHQFGTLCHASATVPFAGEHQMEQRLTRQFETRFRKKTPNLSSEYITLSSNNISILKTNGPRLKNQAKHNWQ
jgi:hypothetical protein